MGASGDESPPEWSPSADLSEDAEDAESDVGCL